MVALTHYAACMTEPLWWTYFKTTAGTDDGATIAEAAGVTAPQVSRWKTGTNKPDADKIISFARHYKRPPVEALIASGYILPSEVGDVIEIRSTAADIPDEGLLDELSDRLLHRSPNKGEPVARLEAYRKRLRVEQPGQHSKKRG